ncbi:MAG: DNA-processing protein DprA [Bacteroidota bacterium]
MDEKLYQLALTFTPGIGDVLIKQLISYCGSASGVFKSNTVKLTRIPGIGDVIAYNIQHHQKSSLEKAEQELRLIEKKPVQILFYTDANYPDRLKQHYDSPALLYYHGNADLNAARTIGIVGTRQATEYGKAATEDIIRDLQKYSPLVISGLAYGIDIAAHRACLKYQVPTLGVMATGLDIIYPSSHQKTAEAMIEQGGLLTENCFGSKPDGPRFPARNRIIAGMSDALIVVEAAAKGGALITAEFANNYHKDVLAVPGDMNRPTSAGCNKLIQKNKAVIYTDIGALLELLNWEEGAINAKGAFTSKTRTSGSSQQDNNRPFLAEGLIFTEEESQVIALLRTQNEMLMDELSWKSQIPVNRMASLLLNLEFQGIVKALPGKKFVLN